ncbi:hypothetical protein [Acidovorax sp. sic0104]|uniref:hypothetical protein n=1 Tax=Acidovorax sp. sic0104 TaxID=2854784 RepID=UPI001C4618DE|nr:hypothetical protein [Acidovorax sp. sic0104]MBV7542222.1 hypothetical protein [Acidovorax sp. sic0104]
MTRRDRENLRKLVRNSVWLLPASVITAGLAAVLLLPAMLLNWALFGASSQSPIDPVHIGLAFSSLPGMVLAVAVAASGGFLAIACNMSIRIAVQTSLAAVAVALLGHPALLA